MNKKSEPLSIKLEDLVLDKNNPRFAELYSGSEKEEEIIDYLLYNESAEDVAKAIKNADEFYPDRPLWVIKENGKYTVKDGNRRCAAVKALQHPNKYGLGITKMEIDELPVLHYFDVSDIESRIREEHTSNLFKQWDRIAKALEIHRLFKSGNSIESLKSVDSSPKDFLKLANFYFEAVKIGEEDFKRLLRSGRGKTGGKTIIFERLFRYHDKCGYSFKNITNEIVIKDQKLFDSYISAMVHYLKDNPDTTTKFMDSEKEAFFAHLKKYGFPPKSEVPDTTGKLENNSNAGNNQSSNQGTPSTNNANTTNDNSSGNSPKSIYDSNQSNNKRKSIKQRPVYERKRIPAPLEKVIKECYDLDQNNFANAKMALVRVAFECTMKFVVENTKKSNGKALSTSNHIKPAFYDKTGKKLVYTNFDTLKTKFTELILDKSTKNAFENFDLQRPHQIIHNYKVAANPVDSKSMCDNLIELIEFMLQEENDLISSLDTSKL
jgi:hypothetical protein